MPAGQGTGSRSHVASPKTNPDPAGDPAAPAVPAIAHPPPVHPSAPGCTPPPQQGTPTLFTARRHWDAGNSFPPARRRGVAHRVPRRIGARRAPPARSHRFAAALNTGHRAGLKLHVCVSTPPKNAVEHQLESSKEEEEEEEARDCVTRGLCSPMGFGDRSAMAQPPRDRRDVGKVLPPRAENGQRSSLEWMERGRGRTWLLRPHRRALGTCPQTPWVPGGQEGNGCHSAPSPVLADSSTGTLDPAGAASARSASQLPAGEGKSSAFLLKATPTRCHSSTHPLRTLPCTGQDTGVSTLSPVSLQAEPDSGTGED